MREEELCAHGPGYWNESIRREGVRRVKDSFEVNWRPIRAKRAPERTCDQDKERPRTHNKKLLALTERGGKATT